MTDKELIESWQKIPMRIQIAVYNTLVVDVVVTGSREADRIWAAWCRNRYAKHLPMGGACINRADIKRAWDVPVGSEIYSDTVF